MAAVRRFAHVSGLADALVLDADAVHRTPCGVARQGQTADGAQGLVAVLARVAGAGAVAPVAAYLVDAQAGVLARTREALVYVELAVLALEAWQTLAYVAAVVVVTAYRVQTGVTVRTLVDVLLAVRTRISAIQK